MMTANSSETECSDYLASPGLRHFADVQLIDGKVHAVEFLEATEALLGIFDRLGKSFYFIHSDISGNVSKIRQKNGTNPAKFVTLESMMAGPKDEVTVGLVWLIRALEFTGIALQRNLENGGKEALGASFKAAYAESLKRHHNMMVKGVVSVALNACPSRTDFLAKLGSPQSQVEVRLLAWVRALRERTDIVKAAIQAGGHDKGI